VIQHQTDQPRDQCGSFEGRRLKPTDIAQIAFDPYRLQEFGVLTVHAGSQNVGDKSLGARLVLGISRWEAPCHLALLGGGAV
jgi:hypothetical protein